MTFIPVHMKGRDGEKDTEKEGLRREGREREIWRRVGKCISLKYTEGLLTQT